MNEQRSRARVGHRLMGSAVLALLTASCWWGWMAWDRSYQVDPATGDASGPYGAWQVIGCVLSLVVVCVLATVRMPGWIVVPVMTVAFTGAWSGTAIGIDDSGLWLVGAVFVAVGMGVGTVLVSGVTAALRIAGSAGMRTSRHR